MIRCLEYRYGNGAITCDIFASIEHRRIVISGDPGFPGTAVAVRGVQMTAQRRILLESLKRSLVH